MTFMPTEQPKINIGELLGAILSGEDSPVDIDWMRKRRMGGTGNDELDQIKLVVDILTGKDWRNQPQNKVFLPGQGETNQGYEGPNVGVGQTSRTQLQGMEDVISDILSGEARRYDDFTDYVSANEFVKSMYQTPEAVKAPVISARTYGGAPMNASELVADMQSMYGGTPSGIVGDTSMRDMSDVYRSRAAERQRDAESRAQQHQFNAQAENRAREVAQQGRIAQGQAGIGVIENQASRRAQAEQLRGQLASQELNRQHEAREGQANRNQRQQEMITKMAADARKLATQAAEAGNERYRSTLSRLDSMFAGDQEMANEVLVRFNTLYREKYGSNANIDKVSQAELDALLIAAVNSRNGSDIGRSDVEAFRSTMGETETGAANRSNIAEATSGAFQTPRSTRYQQEQDLKLREQQAKAEKAEFESKQALEQGQGTTALTKDARKDYADFMDKGGPAVARSDLNSLQNIAKRLRSGEQLSGIQGFLPEWARAMVDEEGLSTQQAVEQVIQKNLRTILGGQFAQAEAAQLIKRAYDPRLSEEKNAEKLEKAITEIEGMLNERINYFKEHVPEFKEEAAPQEQSQVPEQTINGVTYQYVNGQWVIK